MITATRRIQFCAGHRVYRHESKCKNLHGHNYVALFTAIGELDDVGRVIDFSVLKERLGGWIEENWDHGFLYFAEDDELVRLRAYWLDQKWFRAAFNPTAENMAHFLLHTVAPEVLQGTRVQVIKVTLWETENCFAEASL